MWNQRLAAHSTAVIPVYEIVDFTETDPVEAILELTGGIGVDSAIEALGTQQTFESCVKVTRPGGTISSVRYHGEDDDVKIPPGRVGSRDE